MGTAPYLARRTTAAAGAGMTAAFLLHAGVALVWPSAGCCAPNFAVRNLNVHVHWQLLYIKTYVPGNKNVPVTIMWKA